MWQAITFSNIAPGWCSVFVCLCYSSFMLSTSGTKGYQHFFVNYVTSKSHTHTQHFYYKVYVLYGVKLWSGVCYLTNSKQAITKYVCVDFCLWTSSLSRLLTEFKRSTLLITNDHLLFSGSEISIQKDISCIHLSMPSERTKLIAFLR